MRIGIGNLFKTEIYAKDLLSVVTLAISMENYFAIQATNVILGSVVLCRTDANDGGNVCDDCW